MTMALIISLVFCTLILSLRGGEFHNYLVGEAENIVRQAGFDTAREHPENLPDGGKDFIDLMARRGNSMICIEVETTARNVVSNALKAQRLGRPLIILVPNVKVRKAIQGRLSLCHLKPGGKPVCVLLVGQLQQEVTNCFPFFSAANGGWENRKTNPIEEAGDAC